MELSTEQPSEEESSAAVSETDDAGSVSVPVDDEGFETLAAEIREVLAELAQVIALRANNGYIDIFGCRARYWPARYLSAT